MIIPDNLTDVTGKDESECFILLCMQSCQAKFKQSLCGVASGKIRLAYTAPVNDKEDHDERFDMSKQG